MARILVVDGDPNTVSALQSLLTEDGHTVQSFTDGASALGALTRQQFDVVFVDLDLKGVSGGEIIRAARRSSPFACVLATHARSAPACLAEACFLFAKPLDYEYAARALLDCRRRGGAGESGACFAAEAPVRS